MSATTLAACLSPDYSTRTADVSPDADDIVTETFEYRVEGLGKENPRTISGDLVMPDGLTEPVGGVLVVHENRGLNPYIKDVARRVAKRVMSRLRRTRCHLLADIPAMMMTVGPCSAKETAQKCSKTLNAARRSCSITQ